MPIATMTARMLLDNGSDDAVLAAVVDVATGAFVVLVVMDVEDFVEEKVEVFRVVNVDDVVVGSVFVVYVPVYGVVVMVVDVMVVVVIVVDVAVDVVTVEVVDVDDTVVVSIWHSNE